jgi:hypothetical protein
MPTSRVIFESTLPDWLLSKAASDDAYHTRTILLYDSWAHRRAMDWASRIEPLDAAKPETRYDAQLQLDCPHTPYPRCGSLALSVVVTTCDGEDPAIKAKQVLDIPRVSASRKPPPKLTSFLPSGALSAVRGSSVIGTMPGDWPIGRMVTDYSHYLGSYGQGGVGLSGWQLNRGSWMVLPLRSSAGWITLTREIVSPSIDRSTLDLAIDQRIIGAHPDQLADFPPWDHRYAGCPTIADLPDFRAEMAQVARFETSRSGFVLEATNGPNCWRFAMGDDLPRPIWAGSREPREL